MTPPPATPPAGSPPAIDEGAIVDAPEPGEMPPGHVTHDVEPDDMFAPSAL